MEFIRRQAEAHGVPSPRGTVVNLDLSKQDIATLLGVSRADATRALNALKARGEILIEGSSIILRS